VKVAYLVNEYPKVTHSFIRREIAALEAQGFEVQRIALRGWDGPLPEPQDRRERENTRYVLRAGVLALTLPTVQTLICHPARFLSTLRLTWKMARQSDRTLAHHLVYLAEACQVARWLQKSNVSHVHAHFGTNSTDVALLVHALGGPPYSFTAHGPEEFLRPIGLAEKIRRAAFVVAISSFGRSQLCLWTHHADWAKIKIIRCGLEQEFYRAANGPTAAAPRLVCVGRLAAEKGQLVLVEATARLLAKGIDFQLVLAGDGPIRALVEASIENRSIGSHVRITGWISSAEVRAEILAARALVLPGFAEGLPVVIMEAMALHRPVIATYVAGIPELVRPQENGWLVPAGCADELAVAMEACLSRTAAELERMGLNAYQRVIERHSIDAEAAKLASLFRLHGDTGSAAGRQMQPHC